MNYVACLLVFVMAAAWHLLILRLSPKLGLNKPNFRKQTIPASYGIIMLGYLLAGLWLVVEIYPHTRDISVLVITAAALMCILGFIDDVFGSREATGFRGHFRLLLKHGRLTTGAAKAIGGGIVGVVFGYLVSDGSPVQWILTALLVPLGANTLNLLDLRPGRASGVAALSLCLLLVFTCCNPSFPVTLVALIVTVGFGVCDGLGKAMMGDSGSNQLGTIIGILISTQTNIIFQIAAVVSMVVIQVYSEKHSITSLIEHNPILNRIDRILGVR